MAVHCPGPWRGTGRLAALEMVLALTGCSAQWYKEDADREVYAILADKGAGLLPAETDFSIDVTAGSRLYDPQEPVPEARPTPASAPATAPTVPDRPLTLNDCLALALVNSREFQQRKEALYLAALELTRQRYEFGPKWTAEADADLERDANDEVAGRADGRLAVSRQLADGGNIVLGISHALARSFRGLSTAKTSSSLLALDLTQPLWRGAGRRLVQEALLQAERDVVYEARSFAQFCRTFAVDVATRYYRVLQQYDAEKNFLANYVRLRESLINSQALYQAGRLTDIELGQAQQEALDAENRWIVSREESQSRLDSLKLVLGLPTDAPLVVDQQEIERIPRPPHEETGLELEEAVQTALALRPDLANRRDQVEDARRRVAVARNALEGDLALAASGDVGTLNRKGLDFDFDHRGTYSVDVELKLPLDRKVERNTFRESLIALEQSKRALMELEDAVKLQVREAFRQLRSARQTFAIQGQAVELARRRVDSAQAFREAGRATTRDLLEAQRALVTAQNAWTAALVEYRIAWMNFYRDLGLLQATSKGIVIDEPAASRPR